MYVYIMTLLSLCNCRVAAALHDLHIDCWVMNVVPVSGFNTLPVIYDRGLIGVVHDWYVILSVRLCFFTIDLRFSKCIL